MDITEFCTRIAKELENFYGKEVTVSLKKITKNNGVILNSIIIIRNSGNISPNIYLDELYRCFEKGEDFQDIIERVKKMYEESRTKENIQIGFFMDYESMRQTVAYKLIGYEKNKELLNRIPHIPFYDMTIVFYCIVPKSELENATILIYNNHLQMWGITKEKLYEDAKLNTEKMLPARILPIEKIMEEIFAEDLKNEFSADIQDEDFMPDNTWFDNAAGQMLSAVTDNKKNSMMYVMGNKEKLFGAATILYRTALEEFVEELSCNVFILPSSIHEVILIPDDGSQEGEELWKMVCEINNTQVEPEDVLTDSVYYYTQRSKNIEKLF